MAEYIPNEQQQKFLDTNGCNLLVSASAGSGKTSTMIQKLIQIIDDNDTPITSLLVVTYTNAAGSEIKLKLYNEISKRITLCKDTTKRNWLKEQLDNLGNAEIGTLHAICKKLIVKYFYELNESPNFNMLNDQEQKYLLDIAINNVFGRLIEEEDGEFFDLFDSYNSNRGDDALKKIILQLYNYKVSKTDYNEWKNAFLNNSYSIDLDNNIACKYVMEYYQRELLSYLPLIASLKDCAKVVDNNRYDNYFATREQFVNELSVCSDFSKSLKILQCVSLSSKPRVSEKWPILEREIDEQVAQFNAMFNKTIINLKVDFTSLDCDEITKNISSAKINVNKILEVVDLIDSEYSKLKLSKNVFDFNDLEDKMLKLISSDKIKDILKCQYKYVFVDEYQDINDKQEQILQNLVSGDNYYMIGDVKQSIYAFRQSSPKIFLSKYNAYQDKVENGQVIKFNINYRSDRNILEFANKVFDNIITKQTIGIDYKQDARFDSRSEFTGSHVNISIINDNTKDGDKDIAEANLIVEEIKKVMAIVKDDGSKYNFRDIAIILRSRGDFARILYSVLIKNKIPVKTTMNSEFFASAEVCLLIDILKLVSNINNDIALCSVLKNLFDISESELMSIRESDNNSECLYKVILSYNQNNIIKDKIKNCLEFVAFSKVFLASHTIKEFLTKIIDDYSILLKFKSSSDGNERESNIIDFLEMSDNKNYEYNIDKFLEYIDIVSKEKTTKTVGASDNAIQISTIHHSKGLEYPVVILGKMGKSYQINKDSGHIIINSVFGVGVKSVNSQKREISETVVRSACKLHNKKSEIDEEIRLLYVAMTRAKERLIMTGTYNFDKMEDNITKPIYDTCTNMDMVLKSVPSVYYPSFHNQKEFVIFEGEECEACVSIHTYDEWGDDGRSTYNPIVLNSVNNSLCKSLSSAKGIGEISHVTIKNTVTNILREESDYENLNSTPKTLTPKDSVQPKDALLLGSAYHAVMEKVNFTENYMQIEDIINTLSASGDIDNEMASKIKIELILKAISTIKPLIENAIQVYREKQFVLCDNYNKLVKTTDNNTKVIVQGVIDLVVVREDGVYLIDFKTNRGVSEEDLIKNYTLQLKLYEHAFNEGTNMRVTHKYLYSFYLGKLIEVE